MSQAQTRCVGSHVSPLVQPVFLHVGSVASSQGLHGTAYVADTTQLLPPPQLLSPGPLHAFTSACACPSGQLVRPWKWFTRQMRVAHSKDRDSMYDSSMWKPEKVASVSSSGTHGSPTPPL